MELLTFGMIIGIAPKFYSALSLPYNLQVKVMDRNFMLYLEVFKIFYLLSYFSNHNINILYTDSSYGRYHPKLYPVPPCLNTFAATRDFCRIYRTLPRATKVENLHPLYLLYRCNYIREETPPGLV